MYRSVQGASRLAELSIFPHTGQPCHITSWSDMNRKRVPRIAWLRMAEWDTKKEAEDKLMHTAERRECHIALVLSSQAHNAYIHIILHSTPLIVGTKTPCIFDTCMLCGLRRLLGKA